MDNCVDLEVLIKSENSEAILDPKYYIQENFNELREIIKSISPDILCALEPYSEEKQKSHKISKEEKDSLKGLPDSFIIKLKEAEKNLENLSYRKLYPLFRIPDNMTPEDFNELLKNNIVYKKFMKYSQDDEKY